MTTLTQDQLRIEQRKIRLNAAIAFLVCAAVMAGAYVFLEPYFVFPDALAERLAFAIQADVPIGLVLAVAVQRVSSGRYRSSEDNRGSGFAAPSARIAIDVAFLQNTLEQAVIAVIAHLALATVLTGSALVLIPTAVALFVIGRISFRVGYQKGAGARAFGMAMTAIPTALAYSVVLWILVARWLHNS